MLHMIVATHSPQTCPGVVPELRKKVQTSFQKMDEVSKKLGVTMQGSWTYPGGHVSFMLVDAPNAHVVNEMGSELGLIEWNTATIYPVVTMAEVMAHLQQLG